MVNIPLAVLTANPVNTGQVPAEKNLGPVVRTSGQAQHTGQTFGETLSRAAAKMDKTTPANEGSATKTGKDSGQPEVIKAEVRNKTIQSGAPKDLEQAVEPADADQTAGQTKNSQTAVGQVLVQPAAGQVLVNPAAVLGETKSAVAQVMPQPAVSLSETQPAVGQVLTQQAASKAGEESASVPQIEAQAPAQDQSETTADEGPVQPVIVPDTVMAVIAQALTEENDSLPDGGSVPVLEADGLAGVMVKEDWAPESGLPNSQVHVADSRTAIQPADEKAQFLSSPAAQKQLAELLRLMETLAGQEMDSSDQDAAVIERLQQVLKQDFAKIPGVPRDLVKLKELINAHLDMAPDALGELLRDLTEGLAQKVPGGPKPPQAETPLNGFGKIDDSVMTKQLILTLQGTGNAAGRPKHNNPDRTPDKTEPRQSEAEPMLGARKVNGLNGSVAGAPGVRSANGLTSETTADTSGNSGSTAAADQADGPIQNFHLPNEAKMEPRLAGNETLGSSEKQAQAHNMDFGVVNQIAQKVKISTVQEKTEMQIQLKPEFLGKLDLTVSTENGLVTAKFHTGSSHVKAIIEANLNNLRDALADQGVRVDQLTVSVSADRDFSGFQHREPAYQQNRFARGNRMTGHEEDLQEFMAASEAASNIRRYQGGTVDFMA